MLFTFLPLEISQQIMNYLPCKSIGDLFLNHLIPYNYIVNYDYCCKCEIFDSTGNIGWYCSNGKILDKNNGGNGNLMCIIHQEKFGYNPLYTLSKLAAMSSDIGCLKKLYAMGIRFTDSFIVYYSIGYCNYSAVIDEKKCLECVKFVCDTGCYYSVKAALHYAQHVKNNACIEYFTNKYNNIN